MHGFTGLITTVILHMGYSGVFFWMLISAFVPIPSEAVLPFAGALIVTQHAFNLHLLAMTGAVGNLVGSMIGYGIGAWKGRGFFEKYGRYMLISRKDIASADRWFERYGEATVFFTRMLPVIRAFISYPAGISRMNFGKFCLFSFLGGIPWCYLLAWVGIQLGSQWERIGAYMHKADLGVAVVAAVLFALWLWKHLKDLKEDAATGSTDTEGVS